jgi:hypothetical protein
MKCNNVSILSHLAISMCIVQSLWSKQGIKELLAKNIEKRINRLVYKREEWGLVQSDKSKSLFLQKKNKECGD